MCATSPKSDGCQALSDGGCCDSLVQSALLLSGMERHVNLQSIAHFAIVHGGGPGPPQLEKWHLSRGGGGGISP